jgi:ATP-dependent Clp protease protease subunit
MGAVLLTGGAKGKRFALPNAEIMIHQPLYGFQGQASDIAIHAELILKIKQKLTAFVAKTTGKDYDTVYKDMERDNFMFADEALAYGLIDEIVEKKV